MAKARDGRGGGKSTKKTVTKTTVKREEKTPSPRREPGEAKVPGLTPGSGRGGSFRSGDFGTGRV